MSDHDSQDGGFKLPVLGNAAGDGAGEPARYWRSPEEHARAPGFLDALDQEFPPGADLPPEGFARREFLSLLGATAALAGAACTTKPSERILPYTRTPPELTPGNPLHYATAVQRDGLAVGLVVSSWEGRPTKVEGNPEHPTSLGAVGPQELALTMQLYDPARARLIRRQGTPAAFRTFLLTLAEALKSHELDGGARLRFLVEPTSSPALLWLRDRIADRFPRSRVVAFASAGRENVYGGTALAFGKPHEPRYDFSRADVIVSLDADFLRPEGEGLRHARQFADRRDPEKGPLNRLYAVESLLSITGGMADHRLALRPSEIGAFALLLAGEVAQVAQSPLDPGLGAQAAAYFAGRPEVLRLARAAARDLSVHRSGGVVLAGPEQPPLVHVAAHAINVALGSHGHSVTFMEPATPDVRTGPRALAALVAEMRSGQVDTLCITARNPVYGAPVDLELAAALEKVPHAIYHSLHEDETAPHCEWFIPATHPLESWGDARAADGTISICQPLVSPLFSGVTELELFAAFLSEADKGAHGLLREYWRAQAPAVEFEAQWERWLAHGVLPDTANLPVTPAFEWGKADAAMRMLAPEHGRGPELELRFHADAKVGDGRFANVPWLQELPDPLTKLTWDNAALVSPRTAARLQAGTGDVLKLSLLGRTLEAPALVVPGQADDVVGLALGYGRSGTEAVARGVGVNAGLLRFAEAPWFVSGLRAERVPFTTRRLATTQQHWAMEGRPIALEQRAADHQQHPEALTEPLRGPLPTLQKPVEYPDYKWGMAVDVSRCTGCSACVVACQSENNVPVVGKEQVLRSREMHWLRIDRYFQGDVSAPTSMVTQPMLCQHCETAPCEYVCPVNATVHSDEGLNEMVYNRCIGTRYCQNNCPYKVRRFNFLHFTGEMGPLERMGMNPDVTVRGRGVMEKCTYCVQRIERARIDARLEGRRIKDADLKTACQQACPATAITFGNLNDPESEVSQVQARARRYDVLHELNTRPRTAYLVRIKNPNPELG
ncbi:MAG TPA: TAT-variant-translocated molybdopterin oxidoreductase [Myxococcales bacterium]|nr:TAT-variant-translocated molybdopterin oxidoreductase [Myxococcales bacterium]